MIYLFWSDLTVHVFLLFPILECEIYENLFFWYFISGITNFSFDPWGWGLVEGIVNILIKQNQVQLIYLSKFTLQ